MSPPNIDRLVKLPTGCGEQNLVRTALNWVVAKYLQATNQLTESKSSQINRNLQVGMVFKSTNDNKFI